MKLEFNVSSGEVLNLPLTENEVQVLDMAAAVAAERAAQQVVSDRVAAIDARLSAIDVEAIRPLRAIATSTATQFDPGKLAALEAEAVALRVERAGLQPGF